MINFWSQLDKPILVLAPMEDVTDTVFRQVVLEGSRPEFFSDNESLEKGLKPTNSAESPEISQVDLKPNLKTNRPVLFTEFTSCEGIQSVGQARVIHRLKYEPKLEKPIVAQVWGVTPEDYLKTARLVLELGFDGMDINMGCPVKKVIKQGACSALIKNRNLAKEIVLACREGLQDQIPLSIKTRIGFNQIETESWCGFLLKECRPDVLTIHGRTVKEESKVANHWEEIAKVPALRDELSPDTLVIGNGDIQTLLESYQKAILHRLDGVMVGRGIFQNPWFFNPKVETNGDGQLFIPSQNRFVDLEDRLKLLKIHLDLWETIFSSEKSYQVLKKYFKIYISGFPGASQMRNQMMETKTLAEVRGLLDIF